MNDTPEQSAAIKTHDQNVIVIAGAGSGKTRVLVDRFVALLRAHPDWPLASVAAITFTEKAARELRDRLRRAITIEAEQAATPEARTFWQHHSAALDGARIGTIHSLCALIVRANATSLALDPGFAVLDEAEALLAREAALQTALQSLTDQPAAALFVHYGVDDLREALNTALDWPPFTSDAPAMADHVTQLAAEVLNNLRQNSAFMQALAWEPEVPPDPADLLTPMWAAGQQLHSALLSENIEQSLTALKQCAAIKRTGGKDKNWHGALTTVKDMLEIIQKAAKVALAEIGSADSGANALFAELRPHWYAAVATAQAAYRDHKRTLRALDFNDLETQARNLLAHDAIRARYQGTEFNHVLVDEFQDTNAAQREIVYALTGLTRPGSLFVVGDPKQAIYGFRGADVRVFEQVQQEICAAGGRDINMSTSFRTHRGLIDAFNLLFKTLDAGVTYQPLVGVRPSEPHHTPCIEIVAIDPEQAHDEKKANVETRRRQGAHYLAGRLQTLISDGQPIWDRAQSRYRPLTWGDCAVLFPTRTAMPLAEEAFKAAEIPYVTVAGIGYYDRPEVQDVLNLLQTLATPADELALATTLRSPLFGISDDGLYGLRVWWPDLTLWAALLTMPAADQPDREALIFAAETLRGLRAWVGRVTIAELISRSLDATAFLATLSGLPDGARRVGNVEKLLAMARQAGRISLSDFVVLLQGRRAQELREGEAPLDTGGAVQLMTIHASKGLEFPLVAIFQAESVGRQQSDKLCYDPEIGLAAQIPKSGDDGSSDGKRWDKPATYRLIERQRKQREQAERVRLLYVACTRAADKLIVLGELKLNDAEAEPQAPPVTWMEAFQRCFGLRADSPPALATVAFQVLSGQTITAPRRTLTSQPINAQTAEAATPILPYAPPLLRALPPPTESATQLLTATLIAQLGEAHAVRPSDPDRFAYFRHQVLHDTPPTVPVVARGTLGDANQRRVRRLRRAVGDVIHRALQFGLLADAPRTAKLLEQYARQTGLTDDADIKAVAAEAHDLLRECEQCAALQPSRALAAEHVHRELPFSVQLGTRIVNGQIDALLFDPDRQQWTVLDYKTDAVDAAYIRHHSRRYWGQVGIYALAVESITGQTPQVQLFYVRTRQMIAIYENQWRGALDRLDADLDAALN